MAFKIYEITKMNKEKVYEIEVGKGDGYPIEFKETYQTLKEAEDAAKEKHGGQEKERRLIKQG